MSDAVGHPFEMTELRARWAAQRERVAAVLRRIDARGLFRPPRDPDERAWLDEAGDRGPFGEDERAAELARAYFSRRYSR